MTLRLWPFGPRKSQRRMPAIRHLGPLLAATAPVAIVLLLASMAVAAAEPPGCSGAQSFFVGIAGVVPAVIVDPQTPQTITWQGIEVVNPQSGNPCDKVNLEVRFCCPDATGNPVVGCNVNIMNQTFPDACGPGCTILATSTDPQPVPGCPSNSIAAPATSLACGNQACTVQLNSGVNSASGRLAAIGINRGAVDSYLANSSDLPISAVPTSTPSPSPTSTATAAGTPLPGSVAALDAGVAAGRPGGLACLPVTLSSNGQPITATVMNLGFAGAVFSLGSAAINPAIVDQQLSDVHLGAGSERLTLAGNAVPLPDGLLFTVSFAIDPSASVGSYPVSNASVAFDAAGNPLLYPSIETGAGEIRVTQCPGDCNGDGVVTIGEVGRCLGLFQGEPLCSVVDPGSSCPAADADGSGSVTIGEVNLCVQAYTDGCPAATAAATPSPSPAATATPTIPNPCVGDCDALGAVTVNNVLTMVNVALGDASVSACAAGDANGDGEITVDEILAAVQNALNGCLL